VFSLSGQCILQKHRSEISGRTSCSLKILRKIHRQFSTAWGPWNGAKCYCSYLDDVLNPSQTEGFLSFPLKIHFTAEFSKLLLLSRFLPKKNSLFSSQNFSVSSPSPECRAVTPGCELFKASRCVLLHELTLDPFKSRNKQQSEAILHTPKTSLLQPTRQSSSLFQMKANSFCPITSFPSLLKNLFH